MDSIEYEQHFADLERFLIGIPKNIQREIMYAAERDASQCCITQLQNSQTIKNVAKSLWSVIESGDYLSGKVTFSEDGKKRPYVPKKNITSKGKTLTIKGPGLLQNITKYLRKEF